MNNQRFGVEHIGGRLVGFDRNGYDPKIANFIYALNIAGSAVLDLIEVPSGNFVFEIDCSFTQTSTKFIVGAQDTDIPKKFYLGVSGGQWVHGYNQTETLFGTADTNRHIHKFFLEGNQYLDSVLVVDAADIVTSMFTSLKLQNVVVYRVKVWRNNVLVSECEAVPEGAFGNGALQAAEENGLWDIVKQVYRYPSVASDIVATFDTVSGEHTVPGGAYNTTPSFVVHRGTFHTDISALAVVTTFQASITNLEVLTDVDGLSDWYKQNTTFELFRQQQCTGLPSSFGISTTFQTELRSIYVTPEFDPSSYGVTTRFSVILGSIDDFILIAPSSFQLNCNLNATITNV